MKVQIESQFFSGGAKRSTKQKIHVANQPPSIIRALPPTTQRITKELYEKKAFALSQHNRLALNFAAQQDDRV